MSAITSSTQFKLAYANFPRTANTGAVYSQVELVRYYDNDTIYSYNVNYPMGCVWTLDAGILHVYRTTFDSNTSTVVNDQQTGLVIDFTFPCSVATTPFSYTSASHSALFISSYGTNDALAGSFSFDGSRFVWAGNANYCLEIINKDIYLAKINVESVFQTFTFAYVV